MPPVRILVVAALLALSGVDAKKKDKIKLSRWTNDACDGHPSDGGQSDLKLDECHVVDAASIRVHQHNKKKHNKWINAQSDCFVTVYNQHSCLEGRYGEQQSISVPAEFEQCIPLSSQAASLKFWCQYQKVWDPRAFNTTTVIPQTSYSIDNEGSAHPSEYSATIVTSGYSLGNHNEARAEPTAKSTTKALLEERKQYDVKAMWGKHPWAGSDICYKCWTKKSLRFDKIECRSGPRHPIDCGPKPLDVPATQTNTALGTATHDLYFTSVPVYNIVSSLVTTTVPAVVTSLTPVISVAFEKSTFTSVEPTARAAVNETLADELEGRSEHKAVLVHNPYVPDMVMCADAEWDKQGKVDKQEIRLQKFKSLDKCNGKQAVRITFDKPVATTETTVYATTTTRTIAAPAAWV